MLTYLLWFPWQAEEGVTVGLAEVLTECFKLQPPGPGLVVLLQGGTTERERANPNTPDRVGYARDRVEYTRDRVGYTWDEVS